MDEYEGYLTPEEAAARLNRTEGEIWRMLETGILPALLRGELTSKNGGPIGFDFALLPPEGVARVVDQGGDDFTLEWTFAYGNGKAVCTPARKSSIRVLWHPSLLPDIESPKKDSEQVTHVPHVPRFTAQEAAIMHAIREAGCDPLKLPRPPKGKSGIKAVVRAALVGKNPLFPKYGTQFKKAWERLSEEEIAYLG
jgi:hypothetical protein